MQLQMLEDWVQLAPLPMALIRYPEGLILAANMQLAELLGWPQEQMCGHTTRELGLLVDTQQREQIIRRARAQAEPLSFDMQIFNRCAEVLDVQAWVRYARLHGQELLLLSVNDKSEIKRTEEALRSSREKFSLAFRLSTDAVVITDRRSGCLVEVNSNFERLFGWKAREAIGRSAFDLGLWANQQDRDRLIQGINSKSTCQIEAMAQARDGSLYLTQVYGAEFMLNGAPTMLLTIRDISQQRQQELVIRDSEERLNMALESARQGFWDWQIDSGHYYASARTASLHGLGVAPLDGMIDAVFHNMPLDTQRTVYRQYKQMLEATKQPVTLTYKITLPSGSTRHLQAIAHLYRDAQHRPTRMVGIVLDISEAVLHEQQIQASEEKFTALFQASMEPCCVVQQESGQFMEINQSFTDTFGWTPEDIIGLPPSASKFWTDPKHTDEIQDLLQKQEVVRNYPIRFRHKQGQILQCLCSMRQLQVGDETVVTASILDITAQLQAEAALRASQHKFSKAFHNSPDAITIVDLASSHYLEVNEGFIRLSGLAASEVLGRSFHDIGIWSASEQGARLTELFLRDGRIRNQEVSGSHKNGTTLTLSVSIEPFELNGKQCALTTSRDISELKSAEARIEHMAYHDPLTNLPNRSLLADRLNQQITLFKRHKLHGALLFLDLDNFKNINDSLGHSAGDEVLKIVADRFERSVRAEDTVARLGGDEFVVLLNSLNDDPATTYQLALDVGAKIRSMLAEAILLEGHQLHVTSSIGIALIPDHGKTATDLLKHADIAMYRAKDSGRNTIKLFQSSMLEHASDRLRMENDLHQALAKNEFELHYQPLVDARTGTILGAEALLRWVQPGREQQSPGQFIQLLEDNGQIIHVGQWVISEACRSCAALLREGLVDPSRFSMSINISARQFAQPDFCKTIFKTLAETGIPARTLKLEITESIAIKDIDGTIAIMQELKTVGIRFSMDDFGTGFSSLTYLKRLPVDELKIDQSFVRESCREANDAGIIRAIIALASSLNLNVIAEGVEEQLQLEFLQQNGCHMYQGYLFSRPVPLQEFRALLGG